MLICILSFIDDKIHHKLSFIDDTRSYFMNHEYNKSDECLTLPLFVRLVKFVVQHLKRNGHQ